MIEDVARSVHLAPARRAGARKAQSDIDPLNARYQNVYGRRSAVVR